MLKASSHLIFLFWNYKKKRKGKRCKKVVPGCNRTKIKKT